MPLVQRGALSYPIHATLRTWRKNFFELPSNEVWKILGETVAEFQKLNDLHIHVALLMSNHIHLLITPKREKPGALLKTFTHHLSSKLRSYLIEERYEIRSPVYFGRAVKYIYRNPVNARLCTRVEDYPFSTLHTLLGQETSSFHLQETYFGLMSLPSDTGELLHWLNTPEIMDT